MTVSKATIWNMALGHIGVTTRIEDVETDSSVAAYQCRLFFDHCCGLIAGMRPWPFLTQYEPLQMLPANAIALPDIGWGYRYAYPADAVRINALNILGQRRPASEKYRVKYKVVDQGGDRGKAILTDTESQIIEYNVAADNVALYPSAFTEAVALCLATKIGKPLRADATLVKEALAEWKAWADEAATQAMNEDGPDEAIDSEFVTGRS